MSRDVPRLLQDYLRRSAISYPEKQAVIVEGKAYTYGELWSEASALASRLRAGDLRRGDRVAIFMDNTWPCVVSLWGALLAGGVFMIINPQTKADKLRYILLDSGAGILLTDSHLYQVFSQALVGETPIRRIIVSGQDIPNLPEIICEPFVSATDLPTTLTSENIPLDLAALIYTSGSTGQPKGVMMTHQAMTFTLGSLVQYLRLDGNDRILNALPLAFDYGLYQLLISVYLGTTLVLERSFTYPAQILNRVMQEKVTVFPGVPTIFMTLIGMHARSPLGFPGIHRVTNTAAALPPDIQPRLKEIFPNALVFRMYGLTECKRVCYLEPELADVKSASVGKAIPGTEVFLLSESGGPVAAGETGILHVRGPHVMLGYWNKPEQTADMLKPGKYPGERVLCTHDYFTMDADGFLYFQGRSDEIIKTRGEKVSPVEVENCLYAIPGIREAAVIGVPDPMMGEAVKAFIALEPGSTLTEKEIRGNCFSKLENFMVPKEIVILDELPKTATGKIRKKDLKTREND